MSHAAGGPAFRPATQADVPAVVALLRDDPLGFQRESSDIEPYLQAFRRMQDDPANLLIVGERSGQVIACYQLTIISGLSLQGASRAQIEGVRVAAGLRNQGVGARLIGDAGDRARAAGCTLLQLTTSRSRADAQRFYDRLGFTPSHIGYKKSL